MTSRSEDVLWGKQKKRSSYSQLRCTEPSCWFEDGNVVLQAQSSIFKVYKGLLSQESEVFKSMFALPQSSTGPSELYDGCPLVVLQDSAADVRVFIQAIFDHKYAFLSFWQKKVQFTRFSSFLTDKLNLSSTCASLLTITTKYQAQRLRQRVMAPLSLAFPDTLAGYRIAVKESAGIHSFLNKGPSSWGWDERTAIANAARRSGTSILLPAFLLSSCLRNLDDILQSHGLGEVNRDAIITAIPKLSVAAREGVHAALFSSDRDLSPNCAQPVKCYQARHARTTEIEERPNVFNPFHKRAMPSVPERRLCEVCAMRIADSEAKMLVEWERLPGMFGLGSWDALRKAEKNAAAAESTA